MSSAAFAIRRWSLSVGTAVVLGGRNRANFGIARKVFILAFAALLAGAAGAKASQITLAEVTETMMSVASKEGTALGVALGPDASSLLQFSSFVDPNARTFSFTTLPGQHYLGMAVSLTTVGVYNIGLGQYTWNAAGSVGASSWSDSGSAVWTGDPTETIPEHTVTLFGHSYSVRGTVETSPDPTNDRITLSKGDFVFHDLATPNPKFLGGTSGTDKYNITTGKWTFDYSWTPADKDCSDPCFDMGAVGQQGLVGGDGTFAIKNSPVPETSSLFLLCGGLAILFSRHRLRS